MLGLGLVNLEVILQFLFNALVIFLGKHLNVKSCPVPNRDADDDRRKHKIEYLVVVKCNCGASH